MRRHLPILIAVAILGLLQVATQSWFRRGENTIVAAGSAANNSARLSVTSPVFDSGGRLPAEFTCDGAGISPPVAWSGAPVGTKCYALSLWHTARDREKSYWVVYDIPADVTKLEKNSRTVGRLGLNDKRRNEYEPMCSKGPGLNTYNLTVYALSAEPKLAPTDATRPALLEAIRETTLAEGTLSFQYQSNQAGK